MFYSLCYNSKNIDLTEHDASDWFPAGLCAADAAFEPGGLGNFLSHSLHSCLAYTYQFAHENIVGDSVKSLSNNELPTKSSHLRHDFSFMLTTASHLLVLFIFRNGFHNYLPHHFSRGG